MDVSRLNTTDEAMEELEDRDPTTNIVGYVDAIMGASSPAGAKQEIWTILIWSKPLITEYYKEIYSSRVVDINGGYCLAVSKSKLKDNNLIPYEIIIKENTEVSFLGYHSLSGVTKNEVQNSTFDTIHTLQGLIDISGQIRIKFSLTHNRNGQMTYGLGAIIDGIKKMTIQVKQFVDSKLELCDFVTVTGTVQGQDSLVIVFCDSMADVKYHPEIEVLPKETLKSGCRPVKRIRSFEK